MVDQKDVEAPKLDGHFVSLHFDSSREKEAEFRIGAQEADDSFPFLSTIG